MPSSDELRFERNRLPADRDIAGGIPSVYDPAREERGTEEDTNLYKDYGFAMTKGQKQLEDLYRESIAGITGQYTPITDFDKAYQEWYTSGYQPEILTSPYDSPDTPLPKKIRVNNQLYNEFYHGNYAPTSEIPLEVLEYTPSGVTEQYIPKELTDASQVAQYLTDPIAWQEAFKVEWYNTQPAQYSKANTEFYDVTTELARQKTEVYDSLGVRTSDRLYLDETNDYDRTVISMQQRFEDRIAKKNETLKQLLSTK